MSKIIPTLFLLARPGAGKSEIIAYLKRLDPKKRKEEFHLGEIIILDDFPMLWTWFEEDAILEKMGKDRLHTDQDGYFKFQYLWNLLIKRIGLEYIKLKRDKDFTKKTILIEFSRGKEHGGYRSAFSHFDSKLLEKAGILYVDVSWKESLRKNRKRFNPDRPDSILEHGLPDEKLKKMYFETDWFELIDKEKNTFINNDTSIPYVIFENEDDVTTQLGEKFEIRLKTCLDELWNKM